ncbi:hypothetical protein V6N12_023874 [Hibiscus sabdariffa]|uniref:Uncharacterized protein n=1 Tax=Hibiscus sabdariffa TaxID=183260 RepID=A0ABR2FZC4_9ROSI
MGDQRKLCRVEWDTVCKLKGLGGLGVVNLRLRNLSLLAKWAWCYATYCESLWKALILAKYGHTVYSWRWQSSRPRNMSIVWRQNVQVQDEECIQRHMGFHCFSWFVGRGGSVLFWLDRWCSKDALCHLFSSFTSVGTVAFGICSSNGGCGFSCA